MVVCPTSQQFAFCVASYFASRNTTARASAPSTPWHAVAMLVHGWFLRCVTCLASARVWPVRDETPPAGLHCVPPAGSGEAMRLGANLPGCPRRKGFLLATRQDPFFAAEQVLCSRPNFKPSYCPREPEHKNHDAAHVPASRRAKYSMRSRRVGGPGRRGYKTCEILNLNLGPL